MDAHRIHSPPNRTTLPGLTNLSYFPKMAAHVGLSYPDVVETILDAATVKLRETQNP